MSKTKLKIDMEKMTHFKKNFKNTNHQLSYWMEDIVQDGDTYYKIVYDQFNLYETSS